MIWQFYSFLFLIFKSYFGIVDHHEHSLQREVTVRQYFIFSSIYMVRLPKGNSNIDVFFLVLAAGNWRILAEGIVEVCHFLSLLLHIRPWWWNTEVHQQLIIVWEHVLLVTITPATSTDSEFHGGFKVQGLMASQEVVGATKASKPTSMLARRGQKALKNTRSICEFLWRSVLVPSQAAQ